MATLGETVSALKGDVPRRGALEQTWRTTLLFDRRIECVHERAEPSAMLGVFYTTRRSEAKPR